MSTETSTPRRPPASSSRRQPAAGPAGRRWGTLAAFIALFASLAFFALDGFSEVWFHARVDLGHPAWALLVGSMWFLLGVRPPNLKPIIAKALGAALRDTLEDDDDTDPES